METGFESVDDFNLTLEQRKAMGFIAEFTKRMVVFAFPEPKTHACASNLIVEIYQVTDDVLSGCSKSGRQPACKEGCCWCCFLRVKATPLEVMGIVDYLRARLEPGEMSTLRQQLAKTDEITRGLRCYQRVGAKMSCPLNVDGSCLAYPVRPIACRVYHSRRRQRGGH